MQGKCRTTKCVRNLECVVGEIYIVLVLVGLKGELVGRLNLSCVERRRERERERGDSLFS